MPGIPSAGSGAPVGHVKLRNLATPINAILCIRGGHPTIQKMTVIIEIIKRHLVNMEIAL